MSIALSVNLNKIALLRNSRQGDFPNVTEHGRTCLEAGAQGLTVHPRPDQRHIRPSDVDQLATLIGEYSAAEFNIEGNPFAPPLGSYPGLMSLVDKARPHQCTLVPDDHAQLTSDHGFDLRVDGARLRPFIDQLRSWNVRVSLFMEPDVDQIKLAHDIGADRVELYTGPFAEHFTREDDHLESVFARYCTAAETAARIGLGVNAGHDLNLQNMTLFRRLPHLAEVSIGHALTVEAIDMGLVNTVQAYLKLCGQRQ